MVAVSRRQVPPWEQWSREAYRRWKDGKNKNYGGVKHLYTSFKAYERTFNLKLSSRETCTKLFECLQERGFKVNSDNAYSLIEAYTRLCAGFGQDAGTMCKIYRDSMERITTGKVNLQTSELDKLLLLFGRMGIYDKGFVEHYSSKMARSFWDCAESQIGNFCRYMSRVPYVESERSESHIDALRRGGGCKGPARIAGAANRECGKRLPRHYAKMLANRRSYDFVPKVDYSRSLSDEEQKSVLKGWDFRNSKFIKTLDRRLPYVLHQYTYFNLIDVAEMYYIYGLRSDLVPRFATELWKYSYTLKYGYPLKSLVVLSCLNQGDAITYGRLIRNIPATLTFNWSPELVAEALIACGSLGIKKAAIYNKLAEYLQSRVAYFKNANMVCRIFESLAMARVPQYGLYYQTITLAESFPDWLHLKHLVHIAKSCSALGMVENRMFKLITSSLSQVSECSVKELVPIIKLSSEVKLGPEESQDFYRFIVHFLESVRAKEEVDYEELLELLAGMVSIQARTSEVEQLATRVLRGRKDGVDVVKILRYFGILGRIESKELFQTLEEHVDRKIKEFDEYDLSSLIWDMVAVGYHLYSATLLKVVRKFTQLKPKHFNTHLLTVVASLVRLSGGSDVAWKDFLKIVDEYKDLSWSRSEENAAAIKSVASAIKDSRTFVRQFPYTIDITALYGNVDGTRVGGGNMRAESQDNGGNDGTRVVEATEEARQPRFVDGTGDNRNDVALFYYDSGQNPFVLHIRADGTHEHHFNFYYQTRRKILQSRGWKDTLIQMWVDRFYEKYKYTTSEIHLPEPEKAGEEHECGIDRLARILPKGYFNIDLFREDPVDLRYLRRKGAIFLALGALALALSLYMVYHCHRASCSDCLENLDRFPCDSCKSALRDHTPSPERLGLPAPRKLLTYLQHSDVNTCSPTYCVVNPLWGSSTHYEKCYYSTLAFNTFLWFLAMRIVKWLAMLCFKHSLPAVIPED
ncbi:conserved hypothetical protein [Theileria orientalis strain Shintoku]|uniref:Uncharacterized protein n=1 Tax=Theileria orientalis strain Shintoku TaxID=869250 RepID=J4C7L9_THEOR|nr:conserved hypothetical protein [Theileria orientalis strain Shintoku]BAM39268.1 conserved hypothetical protein [Theileria orientalis strain Shintoku]|eukprot:XP_009689569.1 conserved hypothetical protein [Theileria orientalis strain Shintoku]